MRGPRPWLRPAVFTGSLVPLAALCGRAARHELGANPIAEGLNRLGLTALVFFVLALACTPAKLLFGLTWPARVRRMLGLFAFFYATLHLLVYAVLDQGLAWRALGEDLVKRPFIWVGFTAWLLALPLALTSTKAMVQRLGFPRWQRLHRLAYVLTALGALHFYLRVKKDATEPLAYAGVIAALLASRALAPLRARFRAPGLKATGRSSSL